MRVNGSEKYKKHTMKAFRILGYFLAGSITLILLVAGLSYRSDLSASEANKKYLTPESDFVDVHDARMHIRKRGSGIPVFLIHGSFASLHTWQVWEDSLAKKFMTISVDLPGHGLTGPNANGTYSQNYYRDLMFALADTLRIDSFYVAGNSMGGNVAWRMAIQKPDRVKKLILVDAAGTPRVLKKDSLTNSSRKDNRSRPWIFSIISHPTWGRLLTRFTPRFLFGLNLKQVYANDSLIDEALTDRYYELLLREGNREATIQRLTARQNLFEEVRDSLRIPTLILWGAKDTWIPLSNGERMHMAIPNSKLVVFPNSGHVPHEENPTESVQEALIFLQEKSK